ncbi:MAG: hypothetical protein BWY69_00044 [Planctomycetes bacterium ADurb.Bin401]|jgi:hypothetical protein|nr:MAG: hypothetical protein BWY69_00044 [Planctomycetes bacterium ADurb.Bin401]
MNVIDLADQVALSLNSENYNLSFTAIRTLFPFYELKDLATLHVTVVPKSINIESANRSSNEYDYQVDIAIQKAIKSPDDREVNSLMDLATDIAKSFRGKVFHNLGTVCFKQTIDPLYSVEHIQPPSVFTSVVTLNFKVIE